MIINNTTQCPKCEKKTLKNTYVINPKIIETYPRGNTKKIKEYKSKCNSCDFIKTQTYSI